MFGGERLKHAVSHHAVDQASVNGVGLSSRPDCESRSISEHNYL